MTIETIKTRVNVNTGIYASRVNTIVENRIDEVQDLFIIKNVYNHKWSWISGRAALNTVAQYTTGTFSVTQDSASITGDGTMLTTAYIGYVIRINSEDEYYTITGINAGTQVVTLDKAYIGATHASRSYQMVKIYYELESDVKNILWFKQVVTPRPVLPVAELPFSRVLPDEFQSATGEITGYVLSGQSSSSLMQVRFTPIPLSRKRIYYGYLRKFPTCATALSESQIPSDLHPLFIHKLSEFVFSSYDLFAKAEAEKNVFDSMLFNCVKDDIEIQMDDESVMEDEYMPSRIKEMPSLPGDYPRL